jgi:uncharacterized coiled-coil protein SlyX
MPWIYVSRRRGFYGPIAEIEAKLNALLTKETKMAKTIDDLTTDVEATKTVNASVMTLLTGLTAQITALKSASTDAGTAVKIDALASQMEAQNTDLAAAVTANTPGAPATAAA